jgi:hypothetical protein
VTIDTLPSYKTHDPKGWCGDIKRGAAMGRHSYQLDDDLRSQPVKLVLQRVPLDSGGYDRNGTYFGHGGWLYWYANEDCTIDDVLRARNREDAKLMIRQVYPRARFYR